MKKEEEKYHVPWIDVLAAIIAALESLLIPFVLLIAALLLCIILLRILFL